MKEIHIDTEKVIEFDGKEIHFAYNHEFVDYEEALFCISFKDQNRKNVYYIIADDNFKFCSRNTKKFLFYHECGHIINGDLEFRSFIKNIINSFIRQKLKLSTKSEYEADRHATRILGRNIAVEAMKELIDIKGEMLNPREIDARIERIKSGK